MLDTANWHTLCLTAMTILPRFSQPLVLLLLPLVPVLLYWWWRRGHGALRYSSVGLLTGLPRGRTAWARHGGWLLRFLGLSLLVIALAGPRWPDLGSRLTTEGIALAMVVDASGSMGADPPDFLWDNEKITRLEGAKKLFRLFNEGGKAPDGRILAGRPQDLISFVKYSTRPSTVCPLTLDHGVLFKLLKDVKPGQPQDRDGADSNPGDALALALSGLQKSAVKRKVIILLTDGDKNVDKPKAGDSKVDKAVMFPEEAAVLAGKLSVPIYTIDVNPEANVDEESVKGRAMLKNVAETSGGKYFQASSANALTDVYAQIDQLERSRIDRFEFSKYYDGFLWFSLASLMSWLNLVFLESTLWRRVP